LQRIEHLRERSCRVPKKTERGDEKKTPPASKALGWGVFSGKHISYGEHTRRGEPDSGKRGGGGGL